MTDYSILDISTDVDKDYMAIESSRRVIEFIQDQVEATLEIPIIDDTVNELTEEFNVQLESTVPSKLRAPARAIVTIINDDGKVRIVSFSEIP